MRKLRKDQVDLWLLDCTVEMREIPDVLSGEELAQLEKITNPEAQKQFKNSRNHLRYLICQYLDLEPEKIRISYGAHGKPAIRLPKTTLHFNLSHSKGKILYGFAHSPIGVDLEKIEAREKLQALSERFFSKKNQKILKALADKRQIEFFFKVWTLSEAYLKGLGESVFALETIKNSVSFEDSKTLELKIDSWRLMSLQHIAGFAAAVAIQMEDPQIHSFKI